MSMNEPGERLDETFEHENDETQDWYFDLPSGAWERQEAKNRELRQNLLRQTGEPTDAPRDPLTGRPVPQRRVFGLGRRKDEPRSANGSPEARPLTREERLSRFAGMQDNGAIESDRWSTEAGTFDDADDARPLLRGREDVAEEVPDGGPKSRWEQMFGAGQTGGGMDAMREWAQRTRQSGDDLSEEDPADGDDEATDEIDVPDLLTLRRARLAETSDSAIAEPIASERHEPLALTETTDDGESEPVVGDEWVEAPVSEPATTEPARAEADTPTPRVEAEPGISDAAGFAAMRQWAERGRSEHTLRHHVHLADGPTEDGQFEPHAATEETAGGTDPEAAQADAEPVAIIVSEPDAPSADGDDAVTEGEALALAVVPEPATPEPTGEEHAAIDVPVARLSPGDAETTAAGKRGLFGRLFGRGEKQPPVPVDRDIEGLVASTGATGWLDPDGEIGWGSRAGSERRDGASAADSGDWAFEEPGPEQSAEAVAKAEEPTEDTQNEDTWSTPAAEQPAEAVAPVEEPTEETPNEDTWSTQAAEQPAEAVAEIEESAEETTDDDPWAAPVGFAWSTPAVEQPAEAVAEVEESAEETNFDDPWAAPVGFAWSTPAAEQPAEAVAQVEEPAEETNSDDPWAAPVGFAWSTPAAEQPIEAVGVVEEPAEETTSDDPWAAPVGFAWSTPAVEQPAEAVAEVEEPAEETTADDPWAAPVGFAWSTPAADQPVEAVAQVEEPAEETTADDPWAAPVGFAWSTPAPEQPVEAVAEVEERAEETNSDDPWAAPVGSLWSTPAAEQPVEVVAQIEEPAEETTADDPWAVPVGFAWSTPAAEQPVEAVAEAEEPAEETTSDDPWAAPVGFAWSTPAAEQPVEAVAEVVEPAEETKSDDPWAVPISFATEPVAPVETPAWPQQLPFAFEAPHEVVAATRMDTVDEAGEVQARDAAIADATGMAEWAAEVEDEVDAAGPGLAAGESADGPGSAVAALFGSDSEEKTDDDGEPDLWAAIADEAARKGEGGIATPPPPFGFTGDRRSHGPVEAEEEPEFVLDDAFVRRAESGQEDDLVLRAFEAHASAAEDDEEEDPAPTAPDEFDGLLGVDADGIVDEASSAKPVGVSFAKLQGWTGPVRSTQEVQVDDWVAADEAQSSRPRPLAPRLELASDRASAVDADAERKHHARTLVRELVETGLLALLVFLAVRASFQNFKVDGSSMYPTLNDGQFLIVNKLVYSEVDMERLGEFVPFVEAGDEPTRHVFHAPERGDIVVLQDPSDANTDLIKRVIGLPGERLQIVEGAVYINDYRLEEPYITQPWHGSREAVIVPEGHYFVMGDNRDNSKDSRSSAIGFVPEDLIIGRAEVSYWPTSAFGRAPNADPEVTDERLQPASARTNP